MEDSGKEEHSEVHHSQKWAWLDQYVEKANQDKDWDVLHVIQMVPVKQSSSKVVLKLLTSGILQN